MDFILEGLPNLVREKVGKCSSTKELCDKLHDIYSSPIADLENVKEDADIDQEELCSPCQMDSKDEEYIITRELISALDEQRKEKNSLKKELMKQKESVHIF
jgi:hypothetical protein